MLHFVVVIVVVVVVRFCRGCAIPCDYGQVGNAGKFISIDWDETTFHLKYVMAQEKVRTCGRQPSSFWDGKLRVVIYQGTLF